MFGGQGADHLCGSCIEQHRPFGKARALCVYEGAGLALIHALKYRGKVQLARPLGSLLYAAFARYWDNGEIQTVIPVPLHRKRLRARGFNQAYLLVRDWAGGSLPVLTHDPAPPLTVDRESLVREQMTDPQTGSGRQQRLDNVRHAFAVRDGYNIRGKRILLIDDVQTTGATADACARVLLEGGAENVDVLTVARAM